jgi:hypothetical protein
MTTTICSVQRIWLGAAVLAAMLPASGCGIAYQATLKASEASTRNYQRKTAEYQRQAADLDRQWKGILAQQRSVEARIAAHAKAVKDEKQLAEQNAALRRRIADTEREIGRQEALAAEAARAGRESAFAELGARLTDEGQAAAAAEARRYEAMASEYVRQLAVIRAQPKGSAARRREDELVRGRAVLEVIVEAVALADVPRTALRDSRLGDEPASRQALAGLADAQDALLAALPDFTLRARGQAGYGDEEARRYREVDDRISGLRAAVRESLAALRRAPGDAGARTRPLVSRLEALSTVVEAAGDAATRVAVAMKSGAAPAPASVAKDQVPLAERLLQLIAPPAPAPGERIESPHRAAPSLGRAPWIAALAAYCQAPSFDPEAYLQMRQQELRRLQGVVDKVLQSHRTAARS